MTGTPARVRRRRLARRLLRAALGAGLATLFGWIGVLLAAFFTTLWFILVEGESGNILAPVIVTGIFALIVGVPPALVLGVPAWLVAESAGLLSRRFGAIFGALVGLIICAFSPPLLVVLPALGAVAGLLAVHYADRILPPDREEHGLETKLTEAD